MGSGIFDEFCRTSTAESSEGGDTCARKSTEVHSHPDLPSLRNGGEKLKIFALKNTLFLKVQQEMMPQQPFEVNQLIDFV